MTIYSLAEQTGVVLACLTAISGIIYWAIKSKLKDEFCEKIDCEKKHTNLEASFLAYRKDISEDIKEIKEIVVRIESRFYDWLNGQAKK